MKAGHPMSESVEVQSVPPVVDEDHEARIWRAPQLVRLDLGAAENNVTPGADGIGSVS